ncbi:hypothetical protein Gogos_019987 [Gossypium gossypioides]|uniref:Uncharacterized protein n=1 Tax=Gossypium gossypioides TaxID=34282 RepID=A0A7J9D6D3_GOSGO|nr:hypothetical protein [Gossypium gossypioides]
MNSLSYLILKTTNIFP